MSEFQDLAAALNELHEVRVIAADAKVREELAKKYIFGVLDAGGVEVAIAGGWECRREMRKVNRIDMTALRENCPDVWEKFLKADVNIFLRLRELPS